MCTSYLCEVAYDVYYKDQLKTTYFISLISVWQGWGCVSLTRKSQL